MTASQIAAPPVDRFTRPSTGTLRSWTASAVRDLVSTGAIFLWSIAPLALLLARGCATAHAAPGVRLRGEPRRPKPHCPRGGLGS